MQCFRQVHMSINIFTVNIKYSSIFITLIRCSDLLFYQLTLSLVSNMSAASFLLVRFPLSKPQLASKWVQSLGMKNFIPTANTCLCSEHFRTDCFRDYNGKQFLREDAVPTIFTPGQESSKVSTPDTFQLPF